MVSSAVFFFFTVDNQFISLAIWHASTRCFHSKIASSIKDLDLMMSNISEIGPTNHILTIYFDREQQKSVGSVPINHMGNTMKVQSRSNIPAAWRQWPSCLRMYPPTLYIHFFLHIHLKIHAISHQQILMLRLPHHFRGPQT